MSFPGFDHDAFVAQQERRAAAHRARNRGVVREVLRMVEGKAPLPRQGADIEARLARIFPGMGAPALGELQRGERWTSPLPSGLPDPGFSAFRQCRSDPRLRPFTPLEAGVVEIYISAGPRSGSKRCVNDDLSQCRLWKLTWDLTYGWSLGVEAVPAGSTLGSCTDEAVVQPAVSPDGTAVAVAVHCLDASGVALGRDIRTVSSSVARVLRATPPGSYGQYPNWYDDDTVVFNTTTGATSADWQSTLWSVDADARRFFPTERAGPAAAVHTDWGYEDPHSHATPIDRPGGGPRIATFGGFVGERIPQVSDTDGGDLERVDLPVVESDVTTFRECHHASWNISGDRLLCTRYQDPEVIVDSGSSSTGNDVYPIRRLHESCYQGPSGWTTPSPMVEMLSRAKINQTSRATDNTTVLGSFPDTDPVVGGCRSYVWKFGEWCGSDRYVVAALLCVGDPTFGFPNGSILRSRIVLIDLDATGPEAYTDLLSFVEHDHGADQGSWDGVFVTCGRAA
jgi:hypothetical protein